ncbi:MAG TPA: phage major capsid protein [Candidatus Binatus sp.]|jgi:HK97 family phage major capsid protein|nr:phage major capsid protein [Candidatus Binatus sp.]
MSSLKKIIDKFGRPLWVPGISTQVGDTINGYRYVINQSVPQIGSVANRAGMPHRTIESQAPAFSRIRTGYRE